MLDEFRAAFPSGCLVSEVLQVFKNEFVVRVTVNIDGVARATGLATDLQVAVAEDKARVRALAVLGIVEKPRQTAVLPVVHQSAKVVDLSDVIAATDVEMHRLGWSHVEGQSYLMGTFRKSSRSMLTEQELRDFLGFLRSQPTPVLQVTR